MKNYFRQILLIFATLTISTLISVKGANALGFTNMSSMTTAREWHTSTKLDNGKILAAGGFVFGAAYQVSAELFDSKTGKFSSTNPMNSARAYHTATMLPNGKVLIVGGYNGTAETNSAELYDPLLGTFTPTTGSLTTARRNHSATLLSDGKVLIAGGINSGSGYLKSAEIYDPVAGTFSVVVAELAITRVNHTATLLAGGKVLIAGGANGSALSSAELFDPGVGTFTATGNLGSIRTSHSATLLTNGKVLIVGGGNGTSSLSSTEIYNPEFGTFTPTGSMANIRQQHTANHLPDGSVLVTGGYQGTGYTATAERYDTASGLFSTAGSMSSARSNHTANLLPDGRVIIIGGYNGSVSQSSSEAFYQAVSKVAAGEYCTFIIKSDGTLWGWGENSIGQLGDGTTIQRNSPVQIGTDTDWMTVTTSKGGDFTHAIKTNGTLWAWGDNLFGQLGDGTTIGKYAPVQIGTDSDWIATSSGGMHTLALKSDGTLWAWGYNGNTQLGDNTTTDKVSPLRIGTNTDWKFIAAAISSSLAIKNGGTLWEWGVELGSGALTKLYVPTQIGTETSWSSITAASGHALATKSDGTLWAWGENNSYGVISDVVTTTTPAKIGLETNWQSAATYSMHTGALKADGTLWMFGGNWLGQLGIGTTTLQESTPQQVGAADWLSVAVGAVHTAAIKTDGSLWTWGANSSGQLGDGTTTNKNTPAKSFFIQTNPVNGELHVPLNTAISARFSSPMNGETITGATFSLNDGIGPVAGTVAYNDVTRTATFTPSANLLINKSYTATLTTSVTDNGGAPLAANYIWSFTNDTLPPTAGTLNATPGYSKITLDWSGFSDPSSVASYKLVSSTTVAPSDCGGTALYSGSNTAFTETALPDAVTRYYGICATDAAGNSTTVPVTAQATTLIPSILPFSESFDAATLPAGWSLISDGSSDWQFSTSGNATGGTGGYATVDASYAWDTELHSPKIDMSGAANLILEFKTDTTGRDNLTVDISTDGGTVWTNVWSWLNAGVLTTKVSTNISAAVAANPANVMLRFHFMNRDTSGVAWSIDDVRVYPLCTGTLDKQQLTSPFASITTGTITVSSGCTWTATSNSPWVTIDSGTTGTGNGVVSYSILPGSELIGSITIAEQNITVKHTGPGGLDGSFIPSDGYLTTAGTNKEKANILRPVNDSTIFYKVSKEGANYTVQRRKAIDGSPLPGLGDGTIAGDNPGFDLQGRVVLPTLANNNSFPTKAALQSDGKIVVFGYPNSLGTSFELRRLNIDGSIDITFGNYGYINYSYFGVLSGGTVVVVSETLLDADKLLVAVNTGGKVGIARFTANGAVDSLFGVDGTYKTGIGSFYLSDMALDPTGKILLAGQFDTTTANGWLMCLNANGTVYSAFGGGEIGYLTFSNGTWDSFFSVAAQSDGKILVTGESDNASGTAFLSVLRFTGVGQLDSTTFAATAATPGLFLHGGADIGGLNNYYDSGATIAVQTNGKIVVGGGEWSTASGTAAATFLRMKNDGTLDTGFGFNGVATLGYLSGWFQGAANSITMQPDGKLLSAGYIGANNVTIRQNGGAATINVTPDASYPLAPIMLPGSQSSVVEIRNNGEAPLNVSNITLTSPAEFSLDLSWDYGNTCGVTNPILNPGQFCYVLVSFNPKSIGAPSATLSITSDDPANPTADLVFNGNSLADTIVPIDAYWGGSLIANPGNGNVVLTWPVAMDSSGIASYKVVYANGTTAPADCSGTAIFNSPSLTFTHLDLVAGDHSYRVCAIDTPGNVSTGLIVTTTTNAFSGVLWTGGAGDGKWSNAENWSSNPTLPTSSDDVAIKMTGSYTVTLDAGATINSLVVGDGGSSTPTLLISSSPSVIINGTTKINTSASLSLSSSTLTQNGSFISSGSILVGPGATLEANNHFAALALSGSGMLYLANSPAANIATPFTIGTLRLYNSSIEIPVGSVLGALDLLNSATVTLNQDLDTATTNITTGPSSSATINGASGSITNSVGQTLELNGGVTVNVALINAGTINANYSGNIINGSLTTQTGSVLNIANVGTEGSLTVTEGLTNNGDITINSAIIGYPSRLTVPNALFMNAPGAVLTTNGSGSTIIEAQLMNQGTFTTNQNTTINKPIVGHNNSGTMKIPSGVTLTIQNGTFSNNLTGILQGSGTLDLSTGAVFVSNDGTISGGTLGTPGKLSILGTLPNTGNAFTQVDISSTYDQIAVSGPADLAGMLNVSLVDFYPSLGDKFTIMTCGTLCNGWFTTTNLPSPGSNLSWQTFSSQDWNPLGAGGFSSGQADHLSQAFAPDGTLYVAYADQLNGSRGTVMKYSNNIWSAAGGAFSTGTAFYTSLAIGADGLPYVAYQDGGNSNKITVKKFDGWSIWNDVGSIYFSTSTAYYTSLKISPDSTPYLAYVDNNAGTINVTVQKFSSGAWKQVSTALFSADQDTTSLAFAPDGSLYLAYRGDISQSYQSQVMRFDGLNWTTVGGGGASAGGARYNSLAIAPDGSPYLAFMDESNANIAAVRKYVGTSWLDVGAPGLSSGAATNVSLAVTTGGTPYLAYSDGGNGGKAAAMMFDATAWFTVGTVGFSTGAADYTSLALSSIGTPHIAYADFANGNMATVKSLQGAVTLNVTFTLLPSTLPDGTYGVAYNQTVTATSGVAPFTYSVIGGVLPTGLSLNVSSGIITGIPTAVGNFSFTLRAFDNGSNYVDKTYSIVINQAASSISIWPTASAITYGQTLSSSTLSGGATVTPGTFAFTTPSTEPVSGTASHGVTFTPTDAVNYSNASGTASVLVNQATSIITTWPTASAIIYGQTLADSTLSGGSSTPTGSFAWTTPTTAPTAGTASQSITFTPSDPSNYNSATTTISVTVAKADATIIWPTASDITYGLTLASSTLSGGASVPTGAFAFSAPSSAPSAGTAQQSVTFTPGDTTNYSSASGTSSVLVYPKALTVTGITANNKIYDGTTSATLVTSSASLVGVLASDAGNVALNISFAVGTFTPDSIVGTGKTVAISGLSISSSASSNYTLTQPTTTADITNATPSSDSVKIAAGDMHTVFIDANGMLWAMGLNTSGQLGDGTTNQRNYAVRIGTETNWTSLAAGYDSTLAIKGDGTLWAWGDNTYGQLGDGTNVQKNAPVQIGTDTGWRAVSSGNGHTLALKSDGTLWSWGFNNYGQLGDNNAGVDRNTPVQVGTDTTWKAISAGQLFSLATKTDGTLWAWGDNNNGNLGLGASSYPVVPAQVGTDTTWSSISAGYAHVLATKSDRTLWAWGYNGWGQLGLGAYSGALNIPVQVGTDTNWLSAKTFMSHSGALKTDGTLWMFGYNTAGQIGNGPPPINQSFQLTPIQTGTATDWASFAVGNSHTAAVKADGSLWMWGFNNFGQLGNGTAVSKNTPVQTLLMFTSPRDRESQASLTGPVSVTFSKAMATDSISDVTFTLTSDAAVVNGTVTYETATKTATLTPTALSADTLYTASLTAGVTDNLGVPLASPYIWTFIKDTLPPTNGTLSAIPGSGQINLSWSGFVDASEITSFKLVSSGTAPPIDCSGTALYSGSATMYIDSGISAETTRYYGLCVTDAAGNVSVVPLTASATTFAASTLLWETFDLGTLPAGWSTVRNYGSDWGFNTSGNLTGGNGGFAVIENYSGAQLLTPSLDLSASTNPVLEFKSVYTGNDGDADLSVEVSSDGGSTWILPPLLQTSTPYGATTSVFPLAAVVGSSRNNVIIRFTFSDNDSGVPSWAIDDVKIYDQSLPSAAPQILVTTPIAGGVIEDVTFQANGETITATFNVPLDSTTVNSSTFFVKNQDGVSVAGTVTYDSYYSRVSFTPTAFLSGGSTYTVTATTGLQNLSGIAMASNYSWNFTVNPYLGGVASEGNLLITPMNDGTIGVYRYISGSWQEQIFSWDSKGSRLQVNGMGHALGYFGSASNPALISNIQQNSSQIKTAWRTEDGLLISQDLTYQQGAAYYGLVWKVTNESTVEKVDLRFFHGEDTYFNGSDSGAGFWDEPNTTVGVQRTFNGNELRRMSLQAITAPFAYESEYYGTVQNNVDLGALNKTIDPSETIDNGYALEWRSATLAAGTTWTISAFEKFADVQTGAVFVTAPITTACGAGTDCRVTYTVTNTTTSSVNVTLSTLADQAGWSAATSPTSISIAAGSSQQVEVVLNVPSSAADSFIGHLTLSANDGTVTASDTAAINVSAVRQIVTGTDGKTTTPIALAFPDATISLATGTLLTDADGNPISGTLTVNASVTNSISALPSNLASAQTVDGKNMSALGSSIDMTISSALTQVKNISPAMTVTLPLPSTFASVGAAVTYFSFNGTIWAQEGTATVKSDGTIDMPVNHLSVWAAATFVFADNVAPVITAVNVPPTSTTRSIPVNTIDATDNVAIDGYLLTTNTVAPSAADPGWQPVLPVTYDCKTWGNNIIHIYAKDLAGNVSAAAKKVVFVGHDPVTDGVIIPSADTASIKLEPNIIDALRSLRFAMKEVVPTQTELQHGKVAPLVNGIPLPDQNRAELNLGDTIVILRRVVGL